MRSDLLVALDIDGVLRTKRPYDGKFDHGPMAALRLLGEHANVFILVTSTWKDLYSIAELSQKIGYPVIGVTRTLPPVQEQAHPRNREVLTYLRENNLRHKRWIALEDNRDFYPASPNVFFTNPETGLVNNDVQQILTHLGFGQKR